MKLKINKVYLLSLILFCFMFISCNNQNEVHDVSANEHINIVNAMKDGLQNEIIQNLYEEDIENVYELTDAKFIEIMYYETDLNDDGYNDIIAIVASPLHSGSHGDSIDIWINDDNNEYHEVSGLSVVRILPQDSQYPNGEIYIMNDKKNGFKNINIVSDNNNIALVYKNDKYDLID